MRYSLAFGGRRPQSFTGDGSVLRRHIRRWLLQQLQERLLECARLRQSRHARLLENFLLRELRGDLRNIGVLNNRPSGGNIGVGRLQVRHRSLKALLNGTELTADVLELLEREVYDIEGRV